MSAVVGAAVAAVVLSGCAASEGGGTPTSPATPIASAVIGDDFLCSGLSVTREAEKTRVPVSAIGEQGRAALAEAVWDDGKPLDLPPEEDWYVATVTDDHVDILRDMAVVEDPYSGGTAPDHQLLSVQWVEDSTNLSPGWYVFRSSRCALTVDLGELGVPEIELQSPPKPSSRQVQLLVTEQKCNSGEDAEGRIEVVDIDETDTLVSLVLGVRPRGGNQNCPSNPATPFTVTLSDPLGERTIVDAGLVDPRALTVAG
ncbi:hypothetical protein [Cryobacterium arcticum]|uniref:Lipoprotein n=1 Tax=Cryobacterium arcticum TaxID=670052 RepID=A0A317ZJZ6_9MICO|nr:hypothetical protein [Cryobacterium arcticum]PXA65784.1 hypothetical protein CTB96_20195 [Cryobacterium arcticum]